MATFTALLATSAVLLSAEGAAARGFFGASNGDLQVPHLEEAGYEARSGSYGGDILNAYGSVVDELSGLYGDLDVLGEYGVGGNVEDTTASGYIIGGSDKDDIDSSADGPVTKEPERSFSAVGESTDKAADTVDTASSNSKNAVIAPASAAVAGVMAVLAGVAVLTYTKRKALFASGTLATSAAV